MRYRILRVGLKTVITVVAIGAFVAVPAPRAASLLAPVDFKTPGEAAYCGLVIRNYDAVKLVCFTPNDGFTVAMTARGYPRKARVALNFDRYPQAPMLRFGRSWWSSDAGVWICTSRRLGLTCKNKAGHGWWLGRYRGYRLF